MSRSTITSLILAIALTFVVGTEAFAQDSSAQEPAAAPLIEFRIASTSPGPGRHRMKITKPESKTVYVPDSSFITDTDIAHVQSYPAPDGLELVVQMTPEGSERFWKVLSSHIHAVLAIMVDSRLAGAPIILSPVSGNRLPIAVFLPRPAARDLAAKVAARWPEQ
ncbi:MAG TPA: hypothetical protein VFS44_08175 [Gemmatimonadaceae bacterium]|nr:hypothetical protein [Gemmatimonadaceae bacterium]